MNGGTPGGQRGLDATIATLFVAGAAVLLGTAVVAVLSSDPGGAVRVFLTGAFDGSYQIGTTLSLAIPYLFTGAALVVAFRTGVFNIGAEGQLYMGAVAGTAVATQLAGPGPVVIVGACLAGALAGGVWGAIPGVLRARYDAHEVVLTLMLNFIAILLVAWLVAGPLADPDRPGFPQSEPIPDDAGLPRLFPPSTLHLGILIGIGLCIALHLFLTRTRWGYELRMTGENPEFTRYVGLRPDRAIIIAMVLSGALAGVGGIIHVLGDQGRLLAGFSPGYGFVGILIALLARNQPLAVPVAAVFYAWLVSGAQAMEQTTDVPREAISVVQGVLFLLVTATAITMWQRRRRVAKTTASAGTSP